MTLREVLEAAATENELDIRPATADDGSVAWATGDQVFATLSADGAAASFWLDPQVAGAAARTPDVRASARGPGWVELAPRVVDGHAADRARAWFVSGYRRLTGRDG